MYHFSKSFKFVYSFNSNPNLIRCSLLLFPFYSPGNWGTEIGCKIARNLIASSGRAKKSAWAVWLQGAHISNIGRQGSNINTSYILKAFLPDAKISGWEEKESAAMWILAETFSTLGNTCPFPFCVLEMVAWFPFLRSLSLSN